MIYAAGTIIVTEAGGHVSDAKNTNDFFKSGNVIAANINLTSRKLLNSYLKI